MNGLPINDDLLVKYLLGEASAEERHAVESWMQQSDDNLKYLNELKTIWQESKKLAATSEADEQAAWSRFQNRLHKPEQKRSVVKMKWAWMRVAALLVLIAGAALLIFQPGKNTAIQTIARSAGQQVLADTLPDGSMVTLNRHASISYPERFDGKQRRVSLQGEAFFNVMPDKEKPFVIQVNDVTVKVVGTSFNIRSNGDHTEVIVETGIVQVTRNGKTVELRPKQKVVVPRQDTVLVVQEEKEQLYNYYRSKEFVCDGTPLWKLVEVLNEAYGSQIIIENNRLRNLQLTATFSDTSLETILDVIRQTFNITIDKKEDKIILR